MFRKKGFRPPSMRNTDWVALTIGGGLLAGAIGSLLAGESAATWARPVAVVFGAVSVGCFAFVGFFRRPEDPTSTSYKATCVEDSRGVVVLGLAPQGPPPPAFVLECRVTRLLGGWYGIATHDRIEAATLFGGRIALAFAADFTSGDGLPKSGHYMVEWIGVEPSARREITPVVLGRAEFRYEARQGRLIGLIKR